MNQHDPHHRDRHHHQHEPHPHGRRGVHPGILVSIGLVLVLIALLIWTFVIW